MSVDIADIRARVRRGQYLVKSHAVTHALKEGFERRHMVEAVLDGKIIEDYPAERRVLVCGKAELMEGVTAYLHVVCECADPAYVEFITAYLPDEEQWEQPPFRRRRRTRK
jgi:hypothetical protein